MIRLAGLIFALSTSIACGGSPRRAPNLPSGSTEAEASDEAGPSLGNFGPGPDAPENRKADQTGLATWYGEKFAGKKTSNGERFDPRAMTAAHRKLPFGTWVEVKRVETGRTVRVRINDRGPFGDSRKIIDLSKAAANALGFVSEGATSVEIRVVRGP